MGLGNRSPQGRRWGMQLTLGNKVELNPPLLEQAKESTEGKCAWLRSQIIGRDQEFATPFGMRPITYADHTASGRSLAHIETFIARNVLPFYANTHTEDSFLGARTSHYVTEAHKYIKHCLRGTREEALFFCGTGSTAALKRLQEVMGIAVPSTLRSRILSTLKAEERWVVYVGPYEHHSNLLSWRHSLAEVVEIPVNKDGLLDIQKLQAELQNSKYHGRPKLGSFSACSNVTGILCDTRAISELLHARGAYVCFDYSSCDEIPDGKLVNNGSGPYVDIDMRSGKSNGYDAVVLSPHKFVGGPGTPGILLMNKKLYLLGSNPPSTCGGGTVEYVNNFQAEDTIYVEDIEAREDAGTPPIIQKIRCALALWVKEEMGTNLIKKKELFFIVSAIEKLRKHKNIHLLGNTTARRIAIISFLVHTSHLDEYDESHIHKHGESVTSKDSHRRSPLRSFAKELLNISRKPSRRPSPISSQNPYSNPYSISPLDTRSSLHSDLDDDVELEFQTCRVEDFASQVSKDVELVTANESPGRSSLKMLESWVRVPLRSLHSPFHCSSPHRESHSSEHNSGLKSRRQGMIQKKPVTPTQRGKPLHGRFTVKLLNDLFGIQARGGCACAGPYGHVLLGVDEDQSLCIRNGLLKGHGGIKPGWARLSFAYYITNEEFEFILSAIEFIADFGQRFLPLYDFNWYTGDWTFKPTMLDFIVMEPGYGDNQLFHSMPDTTRGLPPSRKKYTNYLLQARCIAEALPPCPLARKVPEEIDPKLVTFRI